MRGSRGQGVRPPPPWKITDPDPLKNHKATKPAFNVGPSSARQRNAILMSFRWRADDGPLIVYLDPPSPYQLENNNKRKRKNVLKVGPPLTKLSGSAHNWAYHGGAHVLHSLIYIGNT